MSESLLKPFMRRPGESLPGRFGQRLAYRALCRYFGITFDRYPHSIVSDPLGNTINIFTQAGELTVLIQDPHAPEVYPRTVAMTDIGNNMLYKYRAFPSSQRVERIIHPHNYAVELNRSLESPDDPAAQIRIQAEADYMKRATAQGLNYIPVRKSEVRGLAAYLGQGVIVLPGGDFSLPTPE